MNFWEAEMQYGTNFQLHESLICCNFLWSNSVLHFWWTLWTKVVHTKCLTKNEMMMISQELFA